MALAVSRVHTPLPQSAQPLMPGRLTHAVKLESEVLRGHEASHYGGIEAPEAVNALRRHLRDGADGENFESIR